MEAIPSGEMKMKTILTFIASLLLTGISFGETINVPDDFPTIQDAIDYASDNDIIMVNAGTYTGTGDSVIDTKGKAIIIQANGGTPESTILDGEGKRRVVVCTSGEDETTIIKGFTITNGYSPYGSGVYCHSSSPRILSCFIVENDAVASSGIRYGGGGVCGYKSSLSLIECLIAYNTCSYSDSNTGGGGISLTFGNGSPLLQECVIRDNDGLEYGGLHASQGCSPILDDCIIKDNSGTGITTYGSNMSLENCEITGHAAGGILVSVYSSTSPTNITNCMISDNQAGRGIQIRNPLGGLIEGCIIENHNSTSMTDGGAGGGIRSTYSGPLDIKDCIVRNNTARSGGGIYLDDNAVGEIQNCIVTGNSATSSWTGSGGGMLIGSATLDNCTVSNNFARTSGGGIQCTGDLALINCTIESNETISNSRFPAIRSRNLIIDGCTFSGNESFYGGPCDIGVLDSCLFRGLNSVSGSVKTWRGLISLDPMTETSLGDLLNVDNYSNVNLQFDIDLSETSPSLLSDGVVITNGCLSIENSSSSLLDAQVGEAFSLMQADVSSSGFGSILFPSMPQGRGLRLIEQSRNSRSVDLAVEVIEVDTPEFGNPFAGDLDSPPTKLRSADVDGDGKDELVVLFNGTPGYVVVYDVFEDGPPVERTTLTTAVGNEPVDLAVSDIDGDGDEDVLVANQADGTISLLISTPASPFGVMTIVVPGGSPVCLGATNWDGDSELDAVVGVDVPGSSKDEFRLILDLTSGGTSGPSLLIPYAQNTTTSDPPTVLDGSDQNGWGFVGGTQSGQILKGTPGSTTLLELIDLENQAITSILTQDLDDNGGDGLLDVAASSGDEGTMYLFQGLTSGFNEGIPITVSLPVTDFTALDADGDQDVDFILVAPGSATEPMTLLRNDGTTSALRVLAGRTWSKQIIASNNSPGSIASGTLDPKDEEDDWVIGGGTILGLRGDPNSTIEKTILNSISADCNADLNRDNIVDINDLLIILSNYGENDSGDIDGDGTSGLDDILIFLASFGTEC